MRAKVGDELIAFDGSGYEFLARVAKLGRTTVDLDITLPFNIKLLAGGEFFYEGLRVSNAKFNPVSPCSLRRADGTLA